jgi:hypothetical protein
LDLIKMPRGGAKPGERRGGRKKNSLNKATIAKLHDAAIVERVAADIGADKTMVDAALKRAQALQGFRAKYELIELAMVMKNHLLHFQEAAMAAGLPGAKGYSKALWDEVKEWGKFYLDLCDTVADFGPDARIKTIAMVMAAPPESPKAQPENIHQIEDANAASRVYLRVVKGGKAA